MMLTLGYMMTDDTCMPGVFRTLTQMATRPFEDWGLPAEGKFAEDVAEEVVSL